MFIVYQCFYCKSNCFRPSDKVPYSKEESIAFRKQWDARAVEPANVDQIMGLNRPFNRR